MKTLQHLENFLIQPRPPLFFSESIFNFGIHLGAAAHFIAVRHFLPNLQFRLCQLNNVGSLLDLPSPESSHFRCSPFLGASTDSAAKMVTYEEIIMQRALRESLQEVKSARECGTLVKAFSYQQTPAGDEEIQGYKDLNEYEVNIDKALHASLQNNTPGAQQSGPLPPPSQNVPNRPNIDDYIKDMHLRTALEMPMVRDPHGDTFV